jgi:hypothetical protein
MPAFVQCPSKVRDELIAARVVIKEVSRQADR